MLLVACQPQPEERFARAENYFAESDYRAAILELKSALQVDPDFAAARLLLAEASYQLGDLPVAQSEYERALGLGEDRPEVWVGLGTALVKQGKTREAFERVLPNLNSETEAEFVLKGDIFSLLGNTEDGDLAYLAAIAKNPDSPGALIGRAVIAAGADDHLSARKLLDAAIKGNPDLALVWRAEGNYLRTQRDLTGAAAAFAKSMASETKVTPLADRFETRVNRTVAFIEAKDFAAASHQLDETRSGFPPHPVLRFLRGRIAFGTGDYALAQSELQEYLARIPRDGRGQAVLGAVNFSQSNLRQAEMYLMQAVRANVGGDSVRRLLAETQLRLQKPGEALAALMAAQVTGQSDAMLLTMLGRAEIGLGDTESAIQYFEQSAAASPGNQSIAMSLAATYLKADRARDAIRVLESIKSVPGSRYQRETLLIGAYLREKRHADAIAQGDELIQENASDATAYALVGVLHNTIGNTDRAVDLFNQTLNLDADNLSALYNLGIMALSAGDADLAVSRFGILLDAHPAYIAGLVSLAAVLDQQGALGEIRPRLEAALERAPNSIAPRVLLARVELAQGHHDRALDIITESRKLFPDEAGLDHLEGVIQLSQGDVENALRSLAQAVASSPENSTYLYDLASARLGHDDFQGAAAAARSYQALRPSDIRGLALLVDAEIRSGTAERAKRDVSAFVTRNPSQAQVDLLLGDIEMASNSPQAAVRHFEAAASKEWTRIAAIQLARSRQAAGLPSASESLERWLSDHPDDSSARTIYAQILENGGDVNRAVIEYEKLYDVGKLNAVGINNLAWQYFLAGHSEAARLAQEAHDMAPGNGNITDTLGWIVFSSGDTERAVDILRKAAEQSPGSPEIQFHLASALARSGDTSEAKDLIDELLSSSADFPSRAQAKQLAKNL